MFQVPANDTLSAELTEHQVLRARPSLREAILMPTFWPEMVVHPGECRLRRLSTIFGRAFTMGDLHHTWAISITTWVISITIVRPAGDSPYGQAFAQPTSI